MRGLIVVLAVVTAAGASAAGALTGARDHARAYTVQPQPRPGSCHAGYSTSIRPPESVTEREKRASLAVYGDRSPPTTNSSA